MRGLRGKLSAVLIGGIALAAGICAPAHAIVGGQEVSDDAWNSTFSSTLRLTTTSQLCGATYIGAYKAVTAGHCVTVRDSNQPHAPQDFDIHGGSPFLNAGGDTVKVVAVHLHPGYIPNFGGKNDIAVLILDRQPKGVKAARISGSDIPYQPGRQGFLAGWGLNDRAGLSERIRAVELTVGAMSDCVMAVPEDTLTDEMMCTGSHQRGIAAGAGKGDSGGGFFMHADSGAVIVGVASWIYPKDNFGRVSPGGATVFTRVDKYLDWIVGVPGR